MHIVTDLQRSQAQATSSALPAARQVLQKVQKEQSEMCQRHGNSQPLRWTLRLPQATVEVLQACR